MAQKGINTCKKLSTSERPDFKLHYTSFGILCLKPKDSELLFEDALTLLKRHKQSSTVKNKET